jgi:coatomer protein complex subunit alpha (xenin)
MVLQAYSLDGVSDSLRKAYKLFTDGKFSNALQAFNQMLWTIPLVVVTSRKEVDEVKELLTICRSAAHTSKCKPTSTYQQAQ